MNVNLEKYKGLITELAEATDNSDLIDQTYIEPNYANTVGDGLGKAILVGFGGNQDADEHGYINHNGEEYICFPDAQNASLAAIQQVKDLLDEFGGPMQLGINFDNLGGIEEYIDEDSAQEIVEDYIYSGLEDLDEDELLETYGTSDIDKIFQDQMSDIDSFVKYIIDQLGEEELDRLIKNGDIDFDIDHLAEQCVIADGPAHTLATYDGKEIDLPNGYYCYRIN